ncbi:uracil-DNA glycosylase [Candidatus Daviesbacteria bacterium]|nr:uracil-DNA glycosylase [Candidatus Daviesbacteria bacterium]
MTKQDQLADLKKRMEEDKSLPLREGATQLVFGEGNPDSQIYFLGEAPGYHEDKQGRPFVGMAGKLLDEVNSSISLKREDVYISNVVRFRPPSNRDPEDTEIAAFQPYVDEEIKIIKPKVVVTLGRFSMGKFFPGEKISQIHGQPRKIKWQGMDLVVIPMYHPAAALRSNALMEALKKDFQIIPEVLSNSSQVEEIQPDGLKAVEPKQMELI